MEVTAIIANPPAPVPVAPKRKFSWRKFMTNLFGSGFSPTERAERKANAQIKKQLALKESMLKAECEAVSNQISWSLADLGICFRKETTKKTVIKRVRFLKTYAYTEEALYLPVDLGPRSRPNGVRVADLADPRTLEDLTITVGRKVDARYSERIGFVYVVWRNAGARGIPSHVKYDDMIALRPSSVGPLAWPLGMGEGKKRHWFNFRKTHAVGIYGTSGGGKSNLINVALCTITSQCSPRILQLYLVDLKRTELGLYQNLPHVAKYKIQNESKEWVERKGFVWEPEDAADMLEWVVKELDRRNEILAGKEFRNISEYNADNKNHPFSNILIVIDEFADMAAADKGKRFREALSRVVRMGRSAGIGIMLCTQYPNKEVISMGIRVNLPATISFPLSNLNASVAVVGSKRAYGMGGEKAGRFIIKVGPSEFEIQAPMLATDKVKSILAETKTGKRYSAELNTTHDVADEEILRWAVFENDGNLTIRGVERQFKDRGMTKRFSESFIDHYKGQTVMVEGTEYIVRHGGMGIATRLIALNSDSQAGSNIVESETEQTP